MRTTIDAAGRIVVPKPLRDQLGLRGGQEVLLAVRDGKLEVEPAPAVVRLQRKGGALRAVPDKPLPPLTVEQVRDAVEQTRR